MKIDTALLLFLCLFFFHCSEKIPFCRSSADCHKGFVCAEAQGNARLLCVRLPSSPPPHLAQQLSTSRVPSPLPTRRTETAPQTTATPRISAASTANTRPLSTPASSADCLAAPYVPQQDPGNGGQTIRIDAQDRALFQTLRLLYHVSRHCSATVWSESFRLDHIPSYFVNIGTSSPERQRPLRGFLLNHPNPPSDAILVDSRQTQGLASVYLYDVQKKQVPPPGFTFHLRINEIQSYAMLYGAQKHQQPSSLSFKRLLIHESFHRAQMIEEAWKHPQGSQNRTGYAFDPQSIALALLENRLLMRGLQSPQPERFLLLFYAVRAHRIMRNPDRQNRIEDYDNYQEWLEGTAMFVEHQFSQIAGFPFQDNDLESIPQRLLIFEQNHHELDQSFVREGLFSRFYGTGAAIGLLLDRIGDTQWRKACREGHTLYQHLQSRWGRLTPQRQRTLLQEAQQKHDMVALQRIGENFSKMLRRYRAQND